MTSPTTAAALARVATLDVIRGFAIVGVVIAHRLHYSWAAMANDAALRASFRGFDAALIVFTILLFTMAGIFYVVSGAANAFATRKRLVDPSARVAPLLASSVLTALWLLALHFVYRALLANGFMSASRTAEFPAGQITGFIRYGEPVPFSWMQLSEPSTLSVLALNSLVVMVPVVLALGTRRGRARPETLVSTLLGAAVVVLLATPFVKWIGQPAALEAVRAGDTVRAALLSLLAHKFGLFPYLAHGLVGAAAGIALAASEPRALLRRLGRIGLGSIGCALAVLAVLAAAGAVRGGLGRYAAGACLAAVALGVHLILLRAGLALWDVGGPPRRPARWLDPVCRFGVCALTVYCLEPVVGQAVTTVWLRLAGPRGLDRSAAALVLVLLLVALWAVLLAAWRKIDYLGSLEWLYARVLVALSLKQSGKWPPRLDDRPARTTLEPAPSPIAAGSEEAP